MAEQQRLYVVGAAEREEPEMFWQYRVYSDREKALKAFGEVTALYPDVWSSINVVVLDDEPMWDFNKR